MYPHAWYHGGFPCLAIYHKGTRKPTVIECPNDLTGGPEVWQYIADLGRKHDPEAIFYFATATSDKLIVLTMTRRVAFQATGPIHRDSDDYSLGEWTIEKMKQSTLMQTN
jgi:hypothetical protein